jgi:pseudouridine-5'-phosphate glycosidase
MNLRLALHPEVGAALAEHRPVVALETSVLAQGLPPPINREAAQRIDAAVRRSGAVPAWVAVIEGVVRVGLEAAAFERLTGGEGVRKIARRDLPAAMAFGETGGTTVSATLHLCGRLGIAVFATGGIGGVHRGAATSHDISEDIAALGSTSAIVVCAGAKAILDLRATLEALESAGVMVVGFRTDEFPAFYSLESGLPLPRRVERPEEAARLLGAARALGIPSALVLAVPPPDPVPAAAVAAWLAAAEQDVAAQGVHGAALTPALLAALGRLSGGRLTAANVALLEQNAAVAATVAGALAGA